MRSNSHGWRIGLACLAGIGSACGGSHATSSAGTAPTFSVSSAEEWGSLEQQGEGSYNTACGSCHPGGQADLGPKLSGIGWSTAQMYAQIREGSNRMKPVSEMRLAESELKGLFVYLTTLGAVSDIPHP